MLQRLNHLDVIRGLMIIWMLVHHISLNYGYIHFGDTTPGVTVFTLMSFFMTPFYVFSGFLFYAKRNFYSFTMNKVRKLLIPYIVFTLFGILVFELYSFIVKHSFDTGFIYSFIPTATFNTNTPCWFFISLFFVCELYYIAFSIVSNLNSKWGGQFLRLGILGCFILAYFTKNHPQYFGYGNILLGLVYFHLGQELKAYEGWIKRNKMLVFVLALIIYCVIGFIYPTSLSFVLNILTRGSYFANLLFSVSACMLLWFVSQKFDNTIPGKSLAYIGRISLVVFAFHRPVLNWILQPMLMKVYPSISYPTFLVVCLIILIPTSIVLERTMSIYTPKLIGK